MYCPRCGVQNPDGSKFCKSCGVQLVSEDVPVAAAASTQPSTSYSNSNTERTTGSKRRHVPKKLALLVVILAAVAVAGGVWWKVDYDRKTAEAAAQQAAWDADHADHEVRINFVAPSYDSSATRIPIHVTGTDLDQQAVDQQFYVNTDNPSIALKKGEYQVSVVASPILQDGSLYSVPTGSVSLSVDGSGGEGDANGGDGQVLCTPEIDLSEITDYSSVSDDQISAARSAAENDPDSAYASRANTYAVAATKKRDDAVTVKANAEKARAEAEKEAQAQKDSASNAGSSSSAQASGDDGTKEAEGLYYRNRSASSSSSGSSDYPANTSPDTVHSAFGSYCHFTDATLKSDGNGGSYIEVNYVRDGSANKGAFYFSRIRVISSHGFSFYYPYGNSGDGDASPLKNATSGIVRYYPAPDTPINTNFAPEDVTSFEPENIV